MYGKAVSAALNALPEDMVAEAMEPGNKGRGFSWLRLAACAAIIVGLFFGFWPTEPEIVTAPGLLTITVYAMDEKSQFKSIVLEEGVSFPYSENWHPGINAVPGLPISLDYAGSENDIRFEISVTGGSVFRSDISHVLGFLDQGLDNRTEFPEKFQIANQVTLFWKDYRTTQNGNIVSAGDSSYLDIIILSRDRIIGYAVIKIQRTYKGLSDFPNGYYAELLVSRYFPCVDGQYQDISKEYVCTMIEGVKAE